MKNTFEFRIAAALVAITALLAGAGLIWRYVYPGAYWTLPEVPNLHGWNGFAIYDWASLVLQFALAAMLVGVMVLIVLQRQRTIVPMLTIAVTLLIAAVTIAIYLPLYGLIDYRTDRILGEVEEPVAGARLLVVSIALTIGTSLALLAVSQLRHAPLFAQAVARTIFVVLCALILHLLIWILIVPISSNWQPSAWDRRDLLRPFEPCRGAVIWQVDPSRATATPIPFGRIDDLWLRFFDPRVRGTTSRAVSVEKIDRRGYGWLSGDSGQAGDDPLHEHHDCLGHERNTSIDHRERCAAFPRHWPFSGDWWSRFDRNG